VKITSEECRGQIGLVQVIRRVQPGGQRRETLSHGLYFSLWQRWESWVIRLGMPSWLLAVFMFLWHPPESIFTRTLTTVPLVGLLCLYFWLLGWRHARDLAATKATGHEVVVNHRLALFPWRGTEMLSVVTLASEPEPATLLALSGNRTGDYRP